MKSKSQSEFEGNRARRSSWVVAVRSCLEREGKRVVSAAEVGWRVRRVVARPRRVNVVNIVASVWIGG